MLQVLLSRVESFLSRAQQDAKFTGILFLIVLFSFFSRQEKVLEKNLSNCRREDVLTSQYKVAVIPYLSAWKKLVKL